jgi:hypothetical protein
MYRIICYLADSTTVEQHVDTPEAVLSIMHNTANGNMFSIERQPALAVPTAA